MHNAEQHLLKILNEEEINTLYARPIFNEEGRERYFTLSSEEIYHINQLAIRSRIYCILELGYFKARHKFFTYTWDAVNADLVYIQQRFYPEHQLTPDAVAPNTRTKYQQLILRLCRFTLFEAAERTREKSHSSLFAETSFPCAAFFPPLAFPNQRVLLSSFGFSLPRRKP